MANKLFIDRRDAPRHVSNYEDYGDAPRRVCTIAVGLLRWGLLRWNCCGGVVAEKFIAEKLFIQHIPSCYILRYNKKDLS